MIAEVLVGGKGTRVAGITQGEIMKHEIQVCGKPFWNYMENWLVDDQEVEVTYNENHLRGVGTAGAIKLTDIDAFPFLLVYGDCFCKIDITQLYRSFLHSGADMAIVTKEVTDPDYGLIDTYWVGYQLRRSEYYMGDTPPASAPRVVGYQRKHAATGSYLTNIGTYLIGERVYRWIRNMKLRGGSEKSLSMEHDVMADEAFFKMFMVIAYDVGELFYYDVGTPERVAATEKQILLDVEGVDTI